MTVQFNDMIATIKRNENGFVITSECKMAFYNNKVTEINANYNNAVTIRAYVTFVSYEQL